MLDMIRSIERLPKTVLVALMLLIATISIAIALAG